MLLKHITTEFLSQLDAVCVVATDGRYKKTEAARVRNSLCTT
jgi:hypothetical protein